jgi:diacylglycerol kinase (ATP)
MAMNRIIRTFNPLLLVRAFNDAGSGLIHAAKSERAVRQEIILIVIGVVAAILLTDASVERALLIGSLGLVLIVELLNSAIETAVDRIGLEQNPLSKQAKDLGSAAVLISLVTAAATWIIILV